MTAKDFFPSQHRLVTLLEADQRDSRGDKSRESEYLLSTSDHDGDGAELLTLNLRFKPLRVAAFDSGDFAVLGWDTANQLPLLAILRSDGVVKRFVDADDNKKVYGSQAATAGQLEGAVFVPFGEVVMLTFPGTTQPVRLLREVGQSYPLTLQIPAGYVLHDVLGSDGWPNIVARIEEARREDGPKAKDTPAPPRQRLVKFSASTGRLVQEFMIEDLPVSVVTCAAKKLLTAVYLEAVGDPVPDSTGSTTQAAKQRVVATVQQ